MPEPELPPPPPPLPPSLLQRVPTAVLVGVPVAAAALIIAAYLYYRSHRLILSMLVPTSVLIIEAWQALFRLVHPELYLNTINLTMKLLL